MPFPDLLCLELGRLATMHPTPLRHGFYSQTQRKALLSDLKVKT